MNNKGFTLVELLAVLVIMGLIMIIAIPSINVLRRGNDEKKYEAYEKSMKSYAETYFEDETGIISLSSLKKAGLSNIDTICSGYVDALNNYKAYLKCDTYETIGYENSKDIQN